MTYRRLQLLSILLCCSGIAFAEHRWFVINTKPASVSRVDATTHKITGETPLSGAPGYAVLSPSGDYLYVLLNGAFDLRGKPQSAASSLAIIDVREMNVTATIDLGWGAHKVALTPSGDHLLVRSAGRPPKKNAEEIPPFITVIDTANNKVLAKWRCPQKNMKFRENVEFVDVTNALVFKKDLSAVYDFSDGVDGGDEPAAPASLTVFRLGNDAPIRQITFPFAGTVYRTYEKDHRNFVALSADERWLYVVETGQIAVRPKNRRNGKVHVVDASTGKLVNTHDIGYTPLKPVVDYVSNSVLIASDGSLGEGRSKIYRFQGSAAPKEWDLNGPPLYIRRADSLGAHLVVSWEEIHLLKDSGELASTPVRLRNTKESGAPKVENELKNVPARSFIALPAIRKLVLGTYGIGGPDGFYPEDDVAVINLDQGRIERNLSIGRGSVKFGKGLLAASLTIAAGMASGYAAYSIGSPVYAYPVFGVRGAGGFSSGTMVANPAQSRIWALNPKTNDVTIVDPVKMTELKKIAVGTSCGNMMRLPAGPVACVVCDDELALLDLEDETVLLKRQFSGAKLFDVGWDERVQELIALTSNSLIAVNPANGQVKAEVSGFHDPMLLVQSR